MKIKYFILGELVSNLKLQVEMLFIVELYQILEQNLMQFLVELIHRSYAFVPRMCSGCMCHSHHCVFGDCTKNGELIICSILVNARSTLGE